MRVEKALAKAKNGHFGSFILLDPSVINLTAQEIDILLRKACRKGVLRAVKFLTKKLNADISAQNKYKQTPLHVACSMNRVDVARYLLDNGARLDDVCLAGETPLKIAFDKNYYDLFKLLLHPKYKPKSGNPLGFLKWHCERDNPAKAKMLALVPKQNVEALPYEQPYVAYYTGGINILELPDELIITIFNFLEPQDILTLLSVCKIWNNVVTQEFIPDTNERWTSKCNDPIFSDVVKETKPTQTPFRHYLFAKKTLRSVIVCEKNCFDSIFASKPNENKIIAAMRRTSAPRDIRLPPYLWRNRAQRVLNYMYETLDFNSYQSEIDYAILSNLPQSILDDLCIRVQRKSDNKLSTHLIYKATLI